MTFQFAEMIRLARMAFAGCDSKNSKGECCEQGKSLDQMCLKCKQYWTEACKYAGQNPNEVIASYQKEKK